jgi:hypothetical protein
MAATAANPQKVKRPAPPGRSPVKTAGAAPRGRGSQGARRSAVPDPNTPAATTPPAAFQRRPRHTPLTPMRLSAAKSMSKLAEHIAADHPDMIVHQHVRDAARTLRAGQEEAAQRHLRAALFSLTPQSLMRNGQHTDDAHMAARAAMHGVHRHLLLVKDIADVAARNQEAIRRDSYGDLGSAPPRPDPNAGYGPGALAARPAARQPGGDQALNAPARGNSGGPDPNVADPVGAQPRGSKQFAVEMSWRDAWMHEARGKGGQWTHSDVAALADKIDQTGREYARGENTFGDKGMDPDAARWMRGISAKVRSGRYHSAADDLDSAAGRLERSITGDSSEKPIVQRLGERRDRQMAGRLREHAAALRQVTLPDAEYLSELEQQNTALDTERFRQLLNEPTGGVRALTYGWGDLAAVIELAARPKGTDLTGVVDLAARNGVHIPGTDFNWKHTYIPLTPAAAASHFRGHVPKGWHPPGGGGGAKAAADDTAMAMRRLGQISDRLQNHKRPDPGAKASVDALRSHLAQPGFDMGQAKSKLSDLEQRLGKGTTGRDGQLASMVGSVRDEISGMEYARSPEGKADTAASKAPAESATHHADWLRIGNFEDSKNSQTGAKTSTLFKIADFGANVHERFGGTFQHPQSSFNWNVNRQRTEREGADARGSHWEGPLASGTEPTMAKAKSAALKAMKAKRAAHIAAGGDVGYGDAPTGDEIRAATHVNPAKGAAAPSKGPAQTFEQALKASKGNISHAPDHQLMASFAQHDLPLLVGAVSPKLVWEAAQKKGMTTKQLAALAHKNPMAVSDLQFEMSYSWNDLAAVIELTGDGHDRHIPGTPYDWRHPWIPLTPLAARQHFKGKIPASWKPSKPTVEAKARVAGEKTSGRAAERTSGTMNAGDWQGGHQAIGQAPAGILGSEHARSITGSDGEQHMVRGAWSDPWWMAGPGGKFAISRRWKSDKQTAFEWRGGGKSRNIPIPAKDERVLTPVDQFGNPLEGRGSKPAADEAAERAHKALTQAEQSLMYRDDFPAARDALRNASRHLADAGVTDPKARQLMLRAQQAAQQSNKWGTRDAIAALQGALPPSAEQAKEQARKDAEAAASAQRVQEAARQVQARRDEAARFQAYQAAAANKTTGEAALQAKLAARERAASDAQISALNKQTRTRGGTVKAAYSWNDLAAVIELSARTAQLEVTPAPYGKPGGPGLYNVKGMKHSDYFEQVVQALMTKRGMDKGHASAVAYGALRRWTRGGHVHPEVRAAAAGALAEEKAKGAAARAVHGHAVSRGELARAAVELSWRGAWKTEARGKEGEWTGSLSGLADKLDSDHPGKGFGDEVRKARDAAGRGDRDKAGEHLENAYEAVRGHAGAVGSATQEGRKAAGNAFLLDQKTRQLQGGVTLARRRGRTWGDVGGEVELVSGGRRVLEFYNPAQPRTAAGQVGGGQFTTGQQGQQGQQGAKPAAKQGGKPAAKPAAPTAHQQHVAHVQHQQNTASRKAGLLATAQHDRAQAAGLIKQRGVLMKALASASGKTSSGQAGSTTSSNATTKSSAPATTASTASTASTAGTTAAGSTASSSPASSSGTSTAAQSASQIRAQIAQLTTQINGLLAAAQQAQAQAAKL